MDDLEVGRGLHDPVDDGGDGGEDEQQRDDDPGQVEGEDVFDIDFVVWPDVDDCFGVEVGNGDGDGCGVAGHEVCDCVAALGETKERGTHIAIARCDRDGLAGRGVDDFDAQGLGEILQGSVGRDMCPGDPVLDDVFRVGFYLEGDRVCRDCEVVAAVDEVVVLDDGGRRGSEGGGQPDQDEGACEGDGGRGVEDSFDHEM